MNRALFLVYGVVAYAFFLFSFLWAVGFVEGIPGVPALDAQPPRYPPLPRAIALNLLLLGAFGVTHSVMARPAFKRWWAAIVPREMERSTFVLVASLLLVAICRGWQPIEGKIWDFEGIALWIARGVSGLGWATVLVSTFLIDHFDLFGLKPSWYAFRGKPCPEPVFKERSLYRWVRHPIMLGFLLAFWAAERMTWSHLLFAAVTTAYILVALQLEERDLVAYHGDSYRDYRRRVSMLLPFRSARR